MSPEVLAENLAEAVAEYYYQKAEEDDFDQETLRLLHHDLSVNIPCRDMPPLKDLKNENRLAGHLKEMEATREAAQHLPQTLLEWWNSQPPKNSSVSGHSKPATKGRMKTSHFEGSIAYWAARAAHGRNERTQCELAAYDINFGGQWLVQPADCA